MWFWNICHVYRVLTNNNEKKCTGSLFMKYFWGWHEKLVFAAFLTIKSAVGNHRNIRLWKHVRKDVNPS